ncbi:MAG: hypothetical protein H2212_14965 [Ruminococcus sp.]|nr:hypothetical protein [Ruminococcus sp.]
MPKINEYTEKTSPDDVDIFLLQDASATKKITFLSIFNQIKTKLGLGGLATKSKISQEDLEAALLNLINGKLTASGMSNDLITTDATKALAAPQGKKLLDFIGTLTALTTTEKTNLVLAINELVTSIDALNRNLQITQTSLTSANAAYFDGNCFAFYLPGGAYIIKAHIILTGAIISGHNAEAFKGFPFKWKYITDIPGATLNNGTSIVMQGGQGESSLKLGTGHGALPVGTIIDVLAVFPPQFVI